ncbi:MAG: mechanosensitive ion channel [Botrimarina sp.]
MSTLDSIRQTLLQAGYAPAEVETRVAAMARAGDTAVPTAGERFEALLNLMTSGQFRVLTQEDWTFLAIQGGMRVALVLVILFLAMTLAGWVGAAARASLTRMRFDATLAKFLSKLARWGVLLLAGLTCLSYFGVETTSFAAVIGAAGFAVGLAFQGTLSNFAAGAMLLMFRPFKVGDVVNIGGNLGIVDEIELFTTTIDTFDNRRFVVPNGDVFGATIENVTFHPRRRVDVEVGSSYSADIDATRRALEQAIEAAEGKLADPEPAVVLNGLGASSVDWRVSVWAPTSEFLAVKQSLIRAVKQSLDANHIGIPFPQMDVHLDGALLANERKNAA